MRTHLLLAILAAFAMSTSAFAQEELGDVDGPSATWTLISVHRTWSPQERDFPNGGFGLQSFFATSRSRTTWFGLSFRGTGVEQRDVLSLMVGPGMFLLGDARLGLFAYAQTGIGMGSSRGLGGFDVFSDPTTTWGLSTVAGVGGSADVAKWLRLHLAFIGSWFTQEKGQTPYGLQFGVTFGGK